MPRIFVNYRFTDTSFVSDLYRELSEIFGEENIFAAACSLAPGSRYGPKIEFALAEADLFISIIGPEWLTVRAKKLDVRALDDPRDWVRAEILQALANNLLILPVLLPNARFPDVDDLPLALQKFAGYQYMELASEQLKPKMETLLDYLRDRYPYAGVVSTAGGRVSLTSAEGPVRSFQGASGTWWTYDTREVVSDEGAYGFVFRGSGADNFPVAVKRVLLRAQTTGAFELRQREVNVAGLLTAERFDYIIPILDTAQFEDVLLLVMPLASRSLRAAIDDGSLSPNEKLVVLRNVAQGLVELATVSVLHRDLKPSNVLDVNGVWKLADFGLARNLREETGTFTFRGFGTPHYIAPELWEAKAATVKSDLYAFGVLSYEVLTGSRPFDASSDVDMMNMHVSAPIPRLPESVAPSLARLIERMLAKDPDERPQDARSVLEVIVGSGQEFTPLQLDLQRVALEIQRKSREEPVEDDEDRNLANALLGLRTLIRDAFEQARSALPSTEVRFEDGELLWSLRWIDLGIEIEILNPRDNSAAASNVDGTLSGEIRSTVEGEILAEVRYQSVGSNSSWRVVPARWLNLSIDRLTANALLEILIAVIRRGY
ncbi:protein kinase [Amycolatopsis sp. A133]|uniref:serine/threonine-protein kinase n=1 Tax=Amycolatopsis sp. A133 TaxID=3064472 RepID=UPI0027FAEF29|nr:protein kinase [Amycolatopsis sp. A133]MDQ7802699.1 protein kinase [Amycolatopsis sp. A133]